jgi:ribosomal protein L7/L12
MHGYQGPVLPGGQLNPQFALQLQSMARNGQKLQAIKMLRQATHSDLLTAKNYVDRL